MGLLRTMTTTRLEIFEAFERGASGAGAVTCWCYRCRIVCEKINKVVRARAVFVLGDLYYYALRFL